MHKMLVSAVPLLTHLLELESVASPCFEKVWKTFQVSEWEFLVGFYRSVTPMSKRIYKPLILVSYNFDGEKIP